MQPEREELWTFPDERTWSLKPSQYFCELMTKENSQGLQTTLKVPKIGLYRGLNQLDLTPKRFLSRFLN
jgi:hypothetical protein